MDFLDSQKVFNIALDILGFWGGNTIAHSVSTSVHKPKGKHVLAYAIADFIVRKGWLGDKLLGSVYSGDIKMKQDTMVAVAGAIGGMLADMGEPMQNIIRGAIGLGSNYALDGIVGLTPLDGKYN
jgi:hypothetical protein